MPLIPEYNVGTFFTSYNLAMRGVDHLQLAPRQAQRLKAQPLPPSALERAHSILCAVVENDQHLRGLMTFNQTLGMLSMQTATKPESLMRPVEGLLRYYKTDIPQIAYDQACNSGVVKPAAGVWWVRTPDPDGYRQRYVTIRTLDRPRPLSPKTSIGQVIMRGEGQTFEEIAHAEDISVLKAKRTVQRTINELGGYNVPSALLAGYCTGTIPAPKIESSPSYDSPDKEVLAVSILGALGLNYRDTSQALGIGEHVVRRRLDAAEAAFGAPYRQEIAYTPVLMELNHVGVILPPPAA